VHTLYPPSLLWTRWLLIVSAAVAGFGFTLVAAPSLSSQGFSLLVYADAGRISSFGAESEKYISLAHAVLGSVMFGWGILLIGVVHTLFARGDVVGWRMVTFSVGAWFVPDTTYSLLSGFWPNGILNVCFLVLFAIPLMATRKKFHGTTPNKSVERTLER